jgi:dTDP-4-amino-4,6-dideoxygalactose transaminase
MTPIATSVRHADSPSRLEAAVPFMDLKAQYRTIEGEVLEALREVAESTSYVLGPRVAAFERAFADYVGARFCVGVNSGTSALHLALICAGVRAGDEVITAPMTFVATTWAVSYCGARPVFVDVDPATRTMDPGQVEGAITARTRAILPVHLYGQSADMGPLLEIGRRRGIPVIEDAAQAHGARYHGRSAGTMGLCGCFSFYPGKNLGAYGEAGAVTTDDESIAARLRGLRDHAQGRRYHHEEIGYNYRMDAFQGAVLGRQAQAARSLDRGPEAPGRPISREALRAPPGAARGGRRARARVAPVRRPASSP